MELPFFEAILWRKMMGSGVVPVRLAGPVVLWKALFVLGFMHRYTVTTTPTDEMVGSPGDASVPRSPGPQRLRLLSREPFALKH